MVIKTLKNRVMKLSREAKLDHFYSLCGQDMTVLDVGVSSEGKAGLPARNYFLKNFRYAPHQYTGLGVEDLSMMGELFPGKRLVHYDGGRFPFEDGEFDWVFSNAVIEHVGDGDDQVLFVNEMLRVSKNVFFTTPNKYFPIEAHTNVPLLHWNNGVFYRWCARYRRWVTKERLYLLSLTRLKKVLEASNASRYCIYNNRMLGWTMTFTVVCDAGRPARS